MALDLLAVQVQAGGLAEVVDGLRDAGGVDRQRRAQRGRELIQQRGALGARPGQDRLHLEPVGHARKPKGGR